MCVRARVRAYSRCRPVQLRGPRQTGVILSPCRPATIGCGLRPLAAAVLPSSSPRVRCRANPVGRRRAQDAGDKPCAQARLSSEGAGAIGPGRRVGVYTPPLGVNFFTFLHIAGSLRGESDAAELVATGWERVSEIEPRFGLSTAAHSSTP